MTESQSANEASTFAQTTATIREAARKVRDTLEAGQTPGQWKTIVRDLVREARLPSLVVAFMLGFIVARR
jgi:hypothetical protein